MLTTITDADYVATIAASPAGAVLFYKKLCPHCKNMEKVLEKFSALKPDVTLFAVDVEENPVAAQAFEALRAPTILVVKQGKVTGKKAGLMNPKEMLAFFEGASA